VTRPPVAAAAARKAVGHDAVLGPVQPDHAFDRDHVGSRTFDPRAHRREALGKVHHFGLARGILERCRALGKTGRHHEVLGARDGHQIHQDAGPFQALCLRRDVTLLDRDRGSECR